MDVKKVSVNGQTMAYVESAGTGAPVVLIHGNSSSSLTFEPQIESDFGRAHRVIALDLPGHGESDPFDNIDDYGMPGYAKMVVGLIQALDVEDAIVVGWSLGGHIALEAVGHLPNAKGVVIYGTPPLAFPPDMGGAFLPNPAVNIGFSPEVDEPNAIAYASSFFVPGAAFPNEPFVSDILRTDGNARAGLGASIKPDGYTDEIDIVGSMTAPLAILHGKEEQLVSEPYISGLSMPTLWRGAVQMIDDAGHAPHWEQPDAFNGLLAAFIADQA